MLLAFIHLLLQKLKTNPKIWITTYLFIFSVRPQDTSTRSISTTNKAFTSRVASVRGGREFLLAVGFEEQAVVNTNPIRTFDSGIIARDTQARH